MRSLAAVALALWVLGTSAVRADPGEADPDLAKCDADFAAGRDAIIRKDWAEAERRLQRAAVREPDSADLHNLLGYAYRNLGKLEPAFKHYKRALEIDPRHRGAHEYIGETYILSGDIAGAERHLAKLREICLLPCEELTDLERAVKAAKSR